MQMIIKTYGTKLLPYSDHMDHLSLEYMTTQFRYQVKFVLTSFKRIILALFILAYSNIQIRRGSFWTAIALALG